MIKNKLIIFDFDGVLANTNELIFGLFHEKNPHLTQEFFIDIHNGNFYESTDRAKEKHGYKHHEDFFTRYGNGLSDIKMETKLHEFIRSMAQGSFIAIASSSNEPNIKSFLEKENIIDYFSDLCGAETHFSKVVKINSLLQKYNLDKNQALFITDTLGDILEGQVCGVQSIGVTWGLQNKINLQKGNPYKIVDDVLQLEKAASDFFKK